MTDAKEVKFIFVCPNKNEMFENSDFKILDNRGIINDDAGNKSLDAKVALDEPCPFCGQKHVYHASELSCPFTGKNQAEFEKDENIDARKNILTTR